MNLEIIHVGLLGTNCYVSWDEDKNCVVVDCGGDADKVADFIREKGLTPTHLLLTHGHGDHMGGAADLKEIFPEIKIVLGKRDLEMIGDGEKSMSNAVAPYAKPFTPDILVKEGDKITSGNTVFTVMEQSRQLETEFLGIEFDGFVQIFRRHAGMLQIGGEFRHWFGHNTLLVMVGTIRFSLL